MSTSSCGCGEIEFDDYCHNDGRSYKNALEITHNDGKLLHFETQEICYAHVYENLDKLKKSLPNFDGAPVKSIICAESIWSLKCMSIDVKF